MIENLPSYIGIIFGLTTLLTLFIFYLAIQNSTHSRLAMPIIVGLVVWLIFQSVMGWSLYYVETAGDIPPKFQLIGFIPTFALMIALFNTKMGKQFIDGLPLSYLTVLSVIRVPIELVLFWLFLNKALPEMLTFEGRNFDILAGLTAPFIAYFGFVKGKLKRKVLLAWNILSLGLLLNIVIMAFLSFPTVFQQFSMDNPLTAMLRFPFVWLPFLIVPIVFFSHFVAIRQLIQKE